MSYEYMTGMGLIPAGLTPPPPQTSQTYTPPASTSAPSGDFVPPIMPRTGIMYVRKRGRKFVLLTPNAKAAKERALQNLHTSEGTRLSSMIRANKMSHTTARQYAGDHHRRFYDGAKLTQEEYDKVQSALGAFVRATTVPNLRIVSAALQETQDAVEQTQSISDQASEEVEELKEEIEGWKKAFEEAQAALTQGGSSGEEVAALLAQINILTTRLDEAKRVADEASADAVEAESEAEEAQEQYEEVVPWYLRYKWQIGIGALVVVAAGGVYWMTSQRPVEKNTRLPAPTSPKHPAGF